jgi:putative oxidoreductase
MRFVVGAVFMTSGLKDLKNPQERSKDIEMSKGFTIFLGAAELAGGLGVILGVFAQLAALGLTVIMLGSIQKIFSFGTQASGAAQGRMAGAMTQCLWQ